jgi:hypothetical protein
VGMTKKVEFGHDISEKSVAKLVGTKNATV